MFYLRYFSLTRLFLLTNHIKIYLVKGKPFNIRLQPFILTNRQVQIEVEIMIEITDR